MADRPTKTQLLRAVQQFLEELVPDLDGVRRFHARVAANALGIVVREIENEAEQLLHQRARLCALLALAPSAASDSSALAAEVEALEAQLCARIRAGDADLASMWRDQLVEHLRLAVGERLSVSNPGYR